MLPSSSDLFLNNQRIWVMPLSVFSQYGEGHSKYKVNTVDEITHNYTVLNKFSGKNQDFPVN